jgi:hypothetical protein
VANALREASNLERFDEPTYNMMVDIGKNVVYHRHKFVGGLNKMETKDSHIKCLCAITEPVFPKHNPLQKQKTYMHHHMFLHLNDKQVSDFCTWWKEINNCGLMNFHPLSPINTFQMIKLKKSFTVSFQNIGNLTFIARISLT